MKPTSRNSMCLMLLGSALLVLSAYLCFAHNDDTGITEHDHLHHDHFAEFAKVPEKARARPNPFNGDPDAIAAGRKLFSQHCAECHGTTAEGGRKAPNLRAQEVQSATPGTLFWILTNGVVRRGMPVWSKLPEPQRWQIITYIRSLPPSSVLELDSAHDHGHSTSLDKAPAQH